MTIPQLIEIDMDKNKDKECKGLIFRGHLNTYWSNRKLVQKAELVLLKRKSCPGCPQCGFMLDDIKEFAENDSLDLTKIEEGKLYTPVITNVSRDWESGIVDDWDIEFNES